MFRLPFLFISTGLICFVLFQVLTLADAADWIGLQPRNPSGWSHVHLLVLGWATMIAMGASYQLINVILRSKIYSETLGFIHYSFFLTGTIGLIYGFQTAKVTWIACFASIAFIGMMLFVWNMSATLLRAKQWNPVTISVGCAIIYLALTALFGMAMGLDFRFQFWASAHEQLFAAHVWLGTMGWFGMLITGISYKLLPMFYLSHGYAVRLQKIVLILWNAGVIVGAASLLSHGPFWLGVLLIVPAVIVYNVHIAQIYKHRHKPKPGAGIVWAIWIARGLMLMGLASLLVLLAFPKENHTNEIVVIGWAYLWGWVALSILAYLSKIVPFLWWTHKYGPQIGKARIPTMSELIKDRYVHGGMALISLSLLLLLAGLSVNIPILISIGGTALALCSLVYICLIALIFTK